MGPLLFLVFINDLPECIQSTCKIFADDVKIYRPLHDPGFDISILQADLIRLSDWSRTWQLGISYEKCKVLCFNFSHDCPLCIDDHVLDSDASSVRDLGVLFTSDFGWKPHCSCLCSKAFRIANCILRALSFKCILHFRKAFVAYCRPVLEYCTQIWSPSTVSDICCVENIQKYFTRVAFRMCFPGLFSPCYRQRLAIFGLKSLEYRRVEFDLILCFKIVRGLCCIKFDDVFPLQKFRLGGQIAFS